MNKTLLVAKREFLTRVQKKTFLLTTILLPVLIFAFYALIIYFSVNADENYHIAIADKANIFKNKIDSDAEITFEFLNGQSEENLKNLVVKGKYEGYLYIPKDTRLLYNDNLQVTTGKSVGLITRENIQDRINDALEQQRLLSLNISPSQLDSAKKSNRIHFVTIGGKDESEIKAGVSYGVGYIAGFMIYIVLFIYGTMVMRGVMEEKVSRIAEVIISSVKPFQLMMGKIIGIGAVGLLQFIIWIILVIGLQFLLPVIFPDMLQQMPAGGIGPGGMASAQAAQSTTAVSGIMEGLSLINFPLVIGCFIFYFLGGYLLYSSLFAAVGSAVNEDPQDAQSLMLPITMPIIFAIVIMTKAVNDPTSSLAIFGSLFPLTSPIVMVACIAHGVPDPVPYWLLFSSMGLLVLGFLGTTWFAAKIYRTGILMYGKKPSWKELMKWAVRKT